jgi:hypothetical protein
MIGYISKNKIAVFTNKTKTREIIIHRLGITRFKLEVYSTENMFTFEADFETVTKVAQLLQMLGITYEKY